MEATSPKHRARRVAVASPNTSSRPPRSPPRLAKGEKARGKRSVAPRALDEQVDEAAEVGDEQASAAPCVSAGVAARKTRSQSVVETLDEAIAELSYGENLPDGLADSPRWHKLLNLMRTAPATL